MPGLDSESNASLVDPYRTFRFRVIWDGRPVAGASRVGGLTQTTQVVSHRTGGATIARNQPGQTAYGPITLERGLTHDVSFANWANKVWDYTNSTQTDDSSETVSLKDFRHDIMIEMQNEQGEVVITYLINRCWVSEFHAMLELDEGTNAIAIQSMTLENEGFERVIPAAGTTPPDLQPKQTQGG